MRGETGNRIAGMEVNIVIFETSGSRCEVVLVSRAPGQQARIWSDAHDGAAEHAQHVLPLLDGLLRRAGIGRAQLTAVAFGQGPGGFTGLRVACGLAQGLAFALDLPVITLPSLLAVAQHDRAALAPQQADGTAWVVLQDARMQEVYAAVYAWDGATGHWHTCHAPCLLSAQHVAPWLASSRHAWNDPDGRALKLRAVGDALTAFPELRESVPFDSVGQAARPEAAAMAWLALAAWDGGQTVPPELAAPLYVRDKVAYTTQEREQGMGGNPKAAAPIAPGTLPVIAAMTEAHLDAVLDIERMGQQFPWTRGNFQDALKAGYGAWVALRDGKVEGFSLVMFAPDIAHLLLIAVAPERRRSSVGSLLVHHALQQTRRRELEALLLEVRPSNQGARAFYQQLGFQELSVRKNYYPADHGQREDALVLWKPLARSHDTGHSGEAA